MNSFHADSKQSNWSLLHVNVLTTLFFDVFPEIVPESIVYAKFTLL